MFKKCKKLMGLVFLIVPLLMLCSFAGRISPGLLWVEKCFKSCFDVSSAGKLKKWDLQVTEKGFFRFRKFFPNGKQEYFSFNIQRFKDLDYLGTIESGEIILLTKSDDIIVQTYNDPKGNIDSMANSIKIPVVNINPEMLDSLRTSLILKGE